MRSSAQTKLIGTRCRFQRISDAHTFGGWVEDFHCGELAIRGDFTGWMSIGDRFLFRLCGEHADATFIAQFSQIRTHGIVRSMGLLIATKNQAPVMEVPEACYGFAVLTDLHYRKPKGEVRKALGAINAFLTVDMVDAEVLLTDASSGGVGFIGSGRYIEAEPISMRFEVNDRVLELDAEVRYSLGIRSVPEMFRTGVKFTEMSRVSRALWHRFLQSV